MRIARRRFLVVGATLAAAAVVVVVHLELIMVEQHEEWMRRSLGNRWQFKDVPTRRGAVLDALGRVLVEDRPALALALHYREFRREHPVGCAVHGANLMLHGSGLSDDYYGYGRPGRGPLAAFEALLRLPCAWLRGGVVPDEVSRDLRFYTASLLAGLSPLTQREAARELRQAQPPDGARLGDLLGPSRVAALRREMAARLAECEAIDAALRGCGEPDGLWQALETRRQRHWASPNDEQRLVTLSERLDFAAGARLELLRERHPGLSVWPAVERWRGAVPGQPDLASLWPVVGVVRPFWREDRARVAGRVDDVLRPDALEQLVPRAPDLPADILDHIEDEARRRVRLHYYNAGRVGASGLELDYDAVLSGRPGLRLVETDRRAQEQGEWSALDVAPGRDLRLTLDLDLQAALESALEGGMAGAGEGCAGVAMAVVEPATGAVLALGGRPLWVDGERLHWTAAAVWPTSGQLGSVVKPFVLLEQLDAARRGRAHADPNGFAPCSRAGYEVAGLGRRLSCSGQHFDGARDGVLSLAHSCNFYFYQAVEGLGPEGLARAFARAGWVEGGEGDRRYQARVPGLAWQRAPRREGRAPLALQAIGYGLAANALSVARAYAALATGVLPTLALVAGERSGVPLDVDSADLALVRLGMRRCVEIGTARGLPELAELGVLAKTGTAEITRQGRNNAWFAGYLSEADPTLAFAAVAYSVPDQRHGGEVAGAMVAALLTAVRDEPELRRRYLPREAGR